MKGELRKARSFKLAPGLQDLLRKRLIGAGAEDRDPKDHEQWRMLLEVESSREHVILYKSGTCTLTAGHAPAADKAEGLILSVLEEVESECLAVADESIGRPAQREKWYAIAEPIRDVYDSLEKVRQDLLGRPGLRRGPVRVSSREEGWAILNDGVRMDPGRYAFTDASGSGGIAVVIVEMLNPEGEPACLREIPSTVSEAVEKGLVKGLNPGELMKAFGRSKHILGEMLALCMALQEGMRLPNVTAWSRLTIVHDYVGVSAWMRAGAPAGAAFEILPGFTDAAEIAATWRPPRDPTVMKVVQACWRFAVESNLLLAFRHQPGHRSEAAGENHFVRFNVRADELAGEAAASHPASLT
jgi:hypothetical protein